MQLERPGQPHQPWRQQPRAPAWNSRRFRTDDARLSPPPFGRIVTTSARPDRTAGCRHAARPGRRAGRTRSAGHRGPARSRPGHGMVLRLLLPVAGPGVHRLAENRRRGVVAVRGLPHGEDDSATRWMKRATRWACSIGSDTSGTPTAAVRPCCTASRHPGRRPGPRCSHPARPRTTPFPRPCGWRPSPSWCATRPGFVTGDTATIDYDAGVRMTPNGLRLAEPARPDAIRGRRGKAAHARPLVRVHPRTGSKVLWASPKNMDHLEIAGRALSVERVAVQARGAAAVRNRDRGKPRWCTSTAGSRATWC